MVKILKLNSTQSLSQSVTKVGIELLGQLKTIHEATKITSGHIPEKKKKLSVFKEFFVIACIHPLQTLIV